MFTTDDNNIVHLMRRTSGSQISIENAFTEWKFVVNLNVPYSGFVWKIVICITTYVIDQSRI